MGIKPGLFGRWGVVGVVVLVVGAIILLWWNCPATTVMVLRHAEKDTTSTQPDNLVPLTTSGEARAITLGEVAARAGVTRIYVTEKLRTQKTAEPLALSRGITPTQIDAANVDALIDELLAWKNRGRVIVVVGHSNTVPVIVERLGGGTVTVDDDQFDNLFVLTLRRWSTTRLIQATYGEPR